MNIPVRFVKNHIYVEYCLLLEKLQIIQSLSPLTLPSEGKVLLADRGFKLCLLIEIAGKLIITLVLQFVDPDISFHQQNFFNLHIFDFCEPGTRPIELFKEIRFVLFQKFANRVQVRAFLKEIFIPKCFLFRFDYSFLALVSRSEVRKRRNNERVLG